MPLPSRETVQRILASGGVLRDRVLLIARRLEALNEYSREQALRVATDIVSTRLKVSGQNLIQGEFI